MRAFWHRVLHRFAGRQRAVYAGVLVITVGVIMEIHGHVTAPTTREQHRPFVLGAYTSAVARHAELSGDAHTLAQARAEILGLFDPLSEAAGCAWNRSHRGDHGGRCATPFGGVFCASVVGQ
jgi:hypothetical protein